MLAEVYATPSHPPVRESVFANGTAAKSSGVWLAVGGDRSLATLHGGVVQLHGRLSHVAALPADWDSYGSPPLSPEALFTATQLLSAVRDSFESWTDAANPYAVVPTSGGGITIEWRGRTKELEVGIGPDGSLGFLEAEMSQAEPLYREDEGIELSQVVRLIAQTIFAA